MEESGEESRAKAHTLVFSCPTLMCIPVSCGQGTGIRLGGKGLSAGEGHLRWPRCRLKNLTSSLGGEGGPVPEVIGVVSPLREHLTMSEDLSGCHRFQGGGGEKGGATGV